VGDIEGHPCGDGDVDVDDYIAVILNWGDCEGGFNLGAPESTPQSLTDCMNKCAEQFPEDMAAWAACVEGCYYATEE
jgi:hypothetical protein